MKKGLAALVIGFSSIAFAQDAPKEAPKAKDVAQHIADNGFVSGFSKDVYWLASEQESNGIFTAFSGAYDFKKVKLYLCEGIYMSNNEVLETCVTDKGLDNKPGACFVGRISEEDTLPHVLFREFSPDYALSVLTERKMKDDEDAKQYCTLAYERLRSEVAKIQPPEQKEK